MELRLPLRLTWKRHFRRTFLSTIVGTAAVWSLGGFALAEPLIAEKPAPPAVPRVQSLPDISGAVSWRDSRVLVVHDAKAGLHDHLPRMGVIDLSKPAQSYTPLAWPAMNPRPSDLESICAIPGHPDEFLAAESGYYKPKDAPPEQPAKYGRVFRIAITGPDAAGLPIVTIKKTFQWPKGVKELEEIEGIACFPCQDQTILVAGNRYGTLLYGAVDLAKDEEFKLPNIVPLPERLPSLTPKFGRLVADLHIDEHRQLWSVATFEPPEEGPGMGTGPFRSAVYPLASLTDQPSNPLRLSTEPMETYMIGGLKVEGLTAVKLPQSFFIGTDDESFGGIWRILEKK